MYGVLKLIYTTIFLYIDMNRDNFISKFSQDTVTLRSYEEHSELTREHVDLFDQLLTSLFRRKKYAHDQNLWEELYKRSLYFYQFADNIEGIPTIFVTKHNDVVPWYASREIHGIKDTIFRVDSHSDMNPVKNNHVLPEIYSEYLSGNRKALDKINQIVWDIGAALSGIIYTMGPRDFVWGIPSWLPDRDISIEYFLSGRRDKFMVSNDPQANDPTCEIVFASKPIDSSIDIP